MITHEDSITINRPVHDVFGFLADFPAVLTWQLEFTEMTPITEGTQRAGYQYRYARKLPLGTQRGTMEITDYQPDRRLSWRAAPGPVLPSGTWTFTAINNDQATRVDEQFTAKITGPLRLLAPLLHRQFSRDVGKDLRAAKRILEAAGTTTTAPPPRADQHTAD